MDNLSAYTNTEFSGANTGGGFVSFYDRIFPEDKLSALYIIKGGPGTGKSTFMRRLGDLAKDRGCNIRHCLCGSDASSLDGILIDDKIGVIDGTPPHPRDFRSPGAAGDILNFGVFWDGKGLRKVRNEIDRLVREKHGFFDTAYRYLGAAGKIDAHLADIAGEFYLKDKAESAAKRLITTIGDSGKCRHRQMIGYTMNGVTVILPTYDNACNYVIIGDPDIGKLFLSQLEAEIISAKIEAEISFDPLNMRDIHCIYFPKSHVLIRQGEADNADKIINMQRFCDRSSLAECRQRLRFGRKCKESLLVGATESLGGAKEKHFQLEEIYKSHMDFEKLSEQSSLWYREILSALD